MGANEIVHRRPGATISHERWPGADLRGEQKTRHMRRRADAAMGLLQGRAAGFQQRHEFLQILRRKILSRHDDGGRMRGRADRHEVARGIVLDVRRQHRRGDMRTHAARQGGAVATRPLPSVPPAPPTFSITMVWPSTLPIWSATIRATTSLGPPAGKGTTTVTGRDG